MTGFRAKLAARQQTAKTLVCVGLDPLPEKLPACLNGQTGSLAGDVEMWMKNIAAYTAKFASMFKPQSAHWEAIPGGSEALGRLIKRLRVMFPDIPVFLDCKRGDIARTQQRYRDAHFVLQGTEGMNFSPYMGKDCMAALVDKENMGRALVGLCYTSNPDAREIQDLRLHDFGDRPLWEVMAEKTLAWATDLGVVENAGLVMAAAYKAAPEQMRIKVSPIYSEHLMRCRQIVGGKLWFLIPGVGAQGGFVEQTIFASYDGPGSIAINSSSEIDFASSGTDYMEAAEARAKELCDNINQFVQY